MVAPNSLSASDAGRRQPSATDLYSSGRATPAPTSAPAPSADYRSGRAASAADQYGSGMEHSRRGASGHTMQGQQQQQQASRLQRSAGTNDYHTPDGESDARARATSGPQRQALVDRQGYQTPERVYDLRLSSNNVPLAAAGAAAAAGGGAGGGGGGAVHARGGMQQVTAGDLYGSPAKEAVSLRSTRGSAAPQQPLSGSGMGVGGGGAAGVSEADLARVEELQQLVDRQALQLRRRNDELLDLQRNHEAFREKFVLFREGMRSKTEEADARCRHLAPHLNPEP